MDWETGTVLFQSEVGDQMDFRQWEKTVLVVSERSFFLDLATGRMSPVGLAPHMFLAGGPPAPQAVALKFGEDWGDYWVTWVDIPRHDSQKCIFPH